MTVPSAEETFRRLTIGAASTLAAIIDLDDRTGDFPRLDARTEALLRVGALVALDASPSSYQTAVEEAQPAGAGLDDLLAALLAVAGTVGSVGSARIISAAPRVALAAGYDVDAALEELEPPLREIRRVIGASAPVAGQPGPSAS
jgi:hypothetical protein